MIFRIEFYKNIFLAGLSGILVLVIAEVYLRAFPPRWLPIETILSVQQTHSELSENPKIGYLPKRNLSKPFKGREFSTLVSINSSNMRDKELTANKSPEVSRIAVFGDSFVFGWGVENNEVFTEILENKYLKNTEVLNFGVSGYCGRQILERVKSETDIFHPDMAVFFVGGIPAECQPSFKMFNGMLYWSDAQPDSIGQQIRSFLRRHFYLWAFWESSRRISGSTLQSGMETKAVAREMSEGLLILKEFIHFCIKKNIQPVLVYFEDEENSLRQATVWQQAWVNSFKKAVEETRTPFLDLTEIFRNDYQKSGKSPYFKYDIHWNRKGHALTAEALSDFFKNRNLLNRERFIRE